MIVGVDIGGTKIAVGGVDGDGRVVARRECLTEPERGPADGLARIQAMIRAVAAEAGGELRGIGIGSTGPIDPFDGAVGKVDTLPTWQGSNLMTPLMEAFGVPVALENDADAAALGEAAWGAGRGREHFVYVTISTGIGAGVVLSGRLYRGTAASHPEIGHHVVDASGPMCYCGARGCWEAVASGPSLAAWARENGVEGENITAATVCALAARGDPIATRAVEREAYYVGVGLGNIISMFCPDAIALGGGVMKSAGLMLERIREVIRTNCTLVPYAKAQIVPACLGENAGLAGAARVWHHRFGR